MKMNWPKDRREIFLRVAEAFGMPPEERDNQQKAIGAYGICMGVNNLCDESRIFDKMENYGVACGIKDPILHWWPCRGETTWTPACDDQRCLFCCLMATLSDEEFREIS